MNCSLDTALAWCKNQSFFSRDGHQNRSHSSPISALGPCYFPDFAWWEVWSLRVKAKFLSEHLLIRIGLIVILLSFLWGLGGNCLCLMAFQRQRRQGRQPYKFQVAIVISDLICLLVGAAYLFNNKLVYLQRRLYLCSMGAFFYMHSLLRGFVMAMFLASMVIVALACLDRREALVDPVGYKNLNKGRKAGASLLATIFVSACIACPTFLGYYSQIEDPELFRTRLNGHNIPAFQLTQEEAFCKFVVKERLHNGRDTYQPNDRYELFLREQNYCNAEEWEVATSIFYGVYFLAWLGLVVAVLRLMKAFKSFYKASRAKRKPEEKKLYIILLIQTSFCLSTGILTSIGSFCFRIMPSSANLFCQIFINLNYIVIGVQTASNFLIFLTLSKAFRVDIKGVANGILPCLRLNEQLPQELFSRRSKEESKTEDEKPNSKRGSVLTKRSRTDSLHLPVAQ